LALLTMNLPVRKPDVTVMDTGSRTI